LFTNARVVDDAIKFVQLSKEKLKRSVEVDDDKESKKSDYKDEDKELEEELKKERGEIITRNQVF
jgi:hypothetical protein